MKAKKYIKIDVPKRYMGKAFIKRFFHLLNLLAPGKYELNLVHGLAAIESKESGLTVLQFSDNPFV